MHFLFYSPWCRLYTQCTHYWGATFTTSKIGTREIFAEIFANNYANKNDANNNDDKTLEDNVTIIANFEDEIDINDDNNNINTDKNIDLRISHSVTDSHPCQNLGSECTTDPTLSLDKVDNKVNISK